MRRIPSLPALSLRARFVLVLLLGAILPLGIVGYWLSRATLRSGEELLRVRLQAGLSRMSREIGANWTNRRSLLYDIAELPQLRAALSGDDAEAAVPDALVAAFERNREDLAELTIHDAGGRLRWRLPDPATADAPTGAMVPVSLDILVPITGERIGSLEARLRFSSLFAGAGDVGGTAGSVLAVFDATTGRPILPVSIESDVIRRPRFTWGAEPWLSVRGSLGEPPIELVLAAPVAPFEQPFAAATRRGTLALVLVALASFGLATLVTARITASLGRIADAAAAVAGGDLEQKVPTEGGRELARLARAFNRMTDHLRSTLADLAQQRSLAAVGEFAASLAHEVRNPLSSVRMDLQMAQEKAGDSPVGGLVGRALGTVERLSATVTGALRVARSGHVRKQPLDLRAVLEAAHHSAEADFLRRGARLAPLAPGDAPIVVNGDAAALEQVFLNLLLNAADAAGEGGSAGLAVRCDAVHVAIRVWDDGAGVPAAVRERVFDAFFSTKPDGTGLGLPIARRIVAAHAGEVAMADGAAGGTVVTVRLRLADAWPRPVAPRPAAAAARPNDLDGRS